MRFSDAGVAVRDAARRRRSVRGLAAAAAVACLVAAGCGGSGSTGQGGTVAAPGADAATAVNQPFQPGGTPVDGGVLTFAYSLDVRSFNPWLLTSNGELFIDMQIYDQLVKIGPDTSKLEPGLATAWSVSDDKRVYTFELRPGVRFSNGDPLTAEDVAYSLEQAADPRVAPLTATFLSTVDSVSIPDPRHVRVQLSRPTTAITSYLALIHILPRRVVERMGPEAFGRRPVGTGPFMVKRFSPGSPTIELVRNPHYWRAGRPYLDGVTFKVTQNDNARMLAVQSGSADIGDAVPFSQIDRVADAPGVALFKQNALGHDWMVINGFRRPLDRTPVRQALAYATPLDQIARVVFRGQAPVAATANMPTKYLDRSIEPLPYDPARARALLRAAGLDRLALTVTIASGDAAAKQVSTILQAAWKEAGIDLSIREQDYGTVVTTLGKQDFDLVNLTTAATSDIPLDDEFDMALAGRPIPGQFPWSGWENAEARRLVEEAASSSDEALRRRNFSAFQRILEREQPILGLVYPPNLYAVRTNVHNFVAAGTSWPLLADTWLQR